MAWNGSGTFARLYSWVARRDAGSPTNIIDATTMDAEFDGFKTGLENCVTLDGQTTPTANLPMGGYRHLNVSAAALRAQYGRVTEIQDGVIWRAASPGGTIDAMTGTLAPAPSAYTAGMIITIIAPGSGSNTVTNPTLNINGLGVKTIKKHQGALVAGDYSVGDTLVFMYDGTYLELLNPKYPPAITIDLSSLTTDSTGGAAADFVAFVDASESNASNKVLVTDFMTNAIGAVTTDTTGGATGDIIPFLDASESSAANKVTIDNLLINALQLLTTDSTGGATGDYVPFVDVSDSNNGNKVLVSDFVYNFLNNGTADAAPDMAADHVLSRDNSASAYKKVLMQYIGAGPQTIWIPAGAMVSRTTNGAAAGSTESATNKIMSKTLDFDASTIEYAQFTVAFPKSWDLSTVTAQFFWRSTNTGNCIWALQGVAISDDDVTDAAFGTAQSVTDGVTATTDTMVSAATSAITIGGTPAAGDLVVFQVYRDASNGSDTLAVDGLLVGVKLIYTTSVNTDT